MTQASNVGGGDSPQMGRAPKLARGTEKGGGKGAILPRFGSSHGEHPNARRERLKRIVEGGSRPLDTPMR